MRTALRAVVRERFGTSVAVQHMTAEPDGRSLIRYKLQMYELGRLRRITVAVADRWQGVCHSGCWPVQL